MFAVMLAGMSYVVLRNLVRDEASPSRTGFRWDFYRRVRRRNSWVLLPACLFGWGVLCWGVIQHF